MSKKKTVDTENLINFKLKRLVHLIFHAEEFEKDAIERQLKMIDLDLEHGNDLRKRPFVDCYDRDDIDQHVTVRDLDRIIHRFCSQFEAYAEHDLRSHLPERSALIIEYDGIDEFGAFEFSINLKTFGGN